MSARKRKKTGKKRRIGGARRGARGAGASVAEELRRAQGDCAQLLETSQRLRESAQRKEELVALCAHDLRAPLDEMLALTRRALGGAHGELGPDQRHLLEAIERQAGRIREVAEELADLRALEAGRPEPGAAPSAPGAAGADRTAITPRPGAVASQARILVVDDEADAREALAQILESRYQVAIARDGEEALRVARSAPPDLILLDLVMPRLDGFAVLEALRQEPRTAEIPVIFVSGRGDELTRAKGLDLGAVDWLAKPSSAHELLARIERTLRLTQRQQQFRQMAQTDTLTGLANLRAFRARVEDEVKRARRYRTPLTCVMADMDYLKPVNDEFGHAAGDRAVAAVADVIRLELRETDFAARYGGDEFVVLLPHTSGADGQVLAERICARLKGKALVASGRRVALSASFGVSELLEGEETGEAMVRRADEALYQAKRSGRGRVAVWSAVAASLPAGS